MERSHTNGLVTEESHANTNLADVNTATPEMKLMSQNQSVKEIITSFKTTPRNYRGSQGLKKAIFNLKELRL
jgi:hypothetical protein